MTSDERIYILWVIRRKKMKCESCGKERNGNEKFCAGCGMVFSETQSAGAAGNNTSALCVNCGRELGNNTAKCEVCGAIQNPNTYVAPIGDTSRAPKRANALQSPFALGLISVIISVIMIIILIATPEGLVFIYLSILGLIEGIYAIIYSIKGIKNKVDKATVGLVLGIIGSIGGLIFTILFFMAVGM